MKKTAILVLMVATCASPLANLRADVLPWGEIKPSVIPTSAAVNIINSTYRQPHYQAPHQTESLMGSPRPVVQSASYVKPGSHGSNPPAGCMNQQPVYDACILRTGAYQEGLQQQAKYLKRQPMRQRAGPGWANVSNAALLQTVRELLSWEGQYTPYSFSERFSLREVASEKRADNSEYTGYFTPLLNVRSQPDSQFRFPIYAPPRWGANQFSRAEVTAGALRGKGLELAWTDDQVNLYFAHIQGSAIARFGDGREVYLDYAASNGKNHVSIGGYLQRRRYMQGSMTNQNIRRWLHEHPDKINEVLHQNPRYVFFTFSNHRPKTSTGAGVIPWHTVAVDDAYIPLGAVLLADVPRIDSQGNLVGSDWRLLFAQDRGDAIKGPGRIDLYTGTGSIAERATYRMTGFRKTYLLVRKPGFLGESYGKL